MNAIPRAHPSAILVGSLFGIILTLFWPLLVDQAEIISDKAWPVSEGSAHVVDRSDNRVTIRMQVRKIRDCKYLQLQAYSIMLGGVLREAYAKRTDKLAQGQTKPPGITWDAGVWDIWPTDGATGIVLWAQYDCGDNRLISTKLAEVTL